MTKDIYEPIGEKLHVEAKRKPRAKRAVGKMRELAAPYGKGPHYKTPCVSWGVRDVLLGTASGYTIAVMYNYNPAAVQLVADEFKRKMRNIPNHPAELHAPRMSVRP